MRFIIRPGSKIKPVRVNGGSSDRRKRQGPQSVDNDVVPVRFQLPDKITVLGIYIDTAVTKIAY